MFRTHDIRASRPAMQRACSRRGIRPDRPAAAFLRGDSVEQAEAREERADLTPDELRAFVKSINFKVMVDVRELEERGPHGIEWVLDSGRLGATMDVTSRDRASRITARITDTRT